MIAIVNTHAWFRPHGAASFRFESFLQKMETHHELEIIPLQQGCPQTHLTPRLTQPLAATPQT